MRIHVALAFLALTCFARAQSVSLTDDEATPEQRALYEKPALAFVEAVLADKPADAYAQFVDELKGQVPGDRFAASLAQSVLPMRPFSDVRVAHSWRVEQAKPGTARGTMVCTAVAKGSIAAPEGRVTVATLPAPLQAHVIVEAKATNNRWAFVLWLTAAQPAWRVAGFHVLPVSVLERGAEDVWKQARAQRDQKHTLNAWLLYVLAKQLAYRGPNLELGIVGEIGRELAALPRPPEVAGELPYLWKFGTETYQVAGLGPIGVGGVFDLNIVHRVAQTADDAALERQNRALIAGFAGAHPEYLEVFDGLVVRAVMPDGQGYGTVEQKRGGK